ncbi:hypothetical protein F4808DRAFT_215353 [Astrocystis sublimbata]|nr:hypothetical protein F4808DRAFT_215353 [Astrocystis sublimbata]
MAHNNGSWESAAPAGDECAPQVRPMGLKVHYTFDKANQERCLARWPQIIHIQTIPVDAQTIGVIDLGLCLQAVAQCSPEVVGDEDKDYAIYATDYSEPDTPLVGQGLLSRGLRQEPESRESKLITGRVTKNLLAIFGNGIKETLEVKLKLTAISKLPRSEPLSRPPSAMAQPPNFAASSSALSESGEWGAFVQSQPGLHSQRQSAPLPNLPTLAPAPVRPHHSSFDNRNEYTPHYQPLQPAPSSRPSSVGPIPKEQHPTIFRQTTPLAPTRRTPAAEETAPSQPIPKIVKPKTQSRPNSRASSRPPTGRPRGRPRKRPLASEGHTSGYEDGTDGDDAPMPAKKRATTTQVERSNSATFGSAPESLRVAASTAGSIRNFRPVLPAGDASARSHLQEEGPRAPTPVPEPRFQGHPNSRIMPQSNLNQQAMAFQPAEGMMNQSFISLNSSMTHDARSPVDSVAPSPFSDDASPADISSSPPVPRSVMYSMQSSPAPSSPVLPPMRPPVQHADSGFMSGGLEGSSRVEEDTGRKITAVPVPLVTVATKPKPRRSRAKKQEPKPQQALQIHNETPGPPELLPQTSIYNPPRPQGGRKKSIADTPMTTESPIEVSIEDSINTRGPETMESIEAGMEEQPMQEAEQMQDSMPPIDFDALEAALNDYPNDQQFMNIGALEMVSSFSPADDTVPPVVDTPQPDSLNEGKMEPPAVPTPATEPSVEPELPAVPASDPAVPQSLQSMPSMLGGPHPQTDAVDGMESRMNKNYVKRQAIKQKLEEAVAMGQMPSFCSNCGALQTPTWRKIWKQECHGVPEYHEYSEKPGHVTAINVLERDDAGQVTLYETIKKSLGPTDDKSKWTETILCNPCGIWFSKWKSHRPAEKWEKDEQRLTQTRKKRAAGGGASRSKKGRAKSESQTNLPSEAYPQTDPIGPSDAPQSPKEPTTSIPNADQDDNVSENGSGRNRKRTSSEPKDQGSTHSRTSRASGTAMSPIDLDDELGVTRRLLFPSPRKPGEQKVLGEVAVNIVQTGPKAIEITDVEKKGDRPRHQTPEPPSHDISDLFGPTPRPSTPPPNKGVNGAPFKTPTRPTPSHRPVTRSVSKSMRSTRSLASPSQRLLERTPTRTPSRKTPRSGMFSNSILRRSPRHQLPLEAMGDSSLGTPLTHSINQMFSDADHLLMPSPSRGGFEIDFSSLPHLDNIDQATGLPHFDFSALLATDSLMPSSPTAIRNSELLGFGGSLEFDIEAHNLDIYSSPRRRDGVKHAATENGGSAQ